MRTVRQLVSVEGVGAVVGKEWQYDSRAFFNFFFCTAIKTSGEEEEASFAAIGYYSAVPLPFFYYYYRLHLLVLL